METAPLVRALLASPVLALMSLHAPSAVAHPASAPPGAECRPVELPFHLDTKRGGIVLDVIVNGRRGSAMLDTGAGHTVVSTEWMRGPGLIPPGRFNSDRAGFTGRAVPVRAALRIGEADLGNQVVHLMNLADVSRAYGRPVDALLGQDVLARFEKVVLDFGAHRVILVPRPEEGCSGPFPARESRQ